MVDMNKLQEITSAITDLRTSGSSGKVFFYVDASDAGGMRHGHVVVYEDGLCCVDFEGLSADAAIGALVSLPIGRVVALPSPGLASPPLSKRGVPATFLTDRLLGTATVTAQVADPVPLTARAGRAQPADDGAASAPRAPAPSPVALVNDVLAVTEQYFGVAASRKVDDLTVRFPPDSDPAGFLRAAEEMLSGMVGARKARELLHHLSERF